MTTEQLTKVESITGTPAERHYTRILGTSLLDVELAVDVAKFCDANKLDDAAVDSLIDLFRRCEK